MYPKDAKNVFINETYLKIIKEEKEKTINSTYEILLKLVIEGKNTSLRKLQSRWQATKKSLVK